VSALSLGSWRTFERIPEQTGIAVLRAALDQGITFFDDARYNDETGRAPIPTGYSEVLFGRLFRGAGVARDEAVVSNKLWWEFWPEQSAAAELDASLGRMGFDYVDLIYANPPPPGLDVADLVSAVGGLVASGKARAWGIVNWTADETRRAVEAAARLGIAPPCAAQLPYSLVRRSWAEDPAMIKALSAPGVGGIIASFCLAGGVLTGKYGSGTSQSVTAAGRAAGALAEPRYAVAAPGVGWPCPGTGGRPRPPPAWTAWPDGWRPPRPRWRSRSRSPTPRSPACCSARPARSSSGPTARPRACSPA